MCSIYHASYLRKPPAGFKPIYNFTLPNTFGKVHIMRQQSCCHDAGCFKHYFPIVDLPKPKSDISERYSIFVANFHTITATLSSTVTGDLILVDSLCI